MKTLHLLVNQLVGVFSVHKNAEKAQGMKVYMKNLFDFAGIQKPIRAQLQKSFVQASKSCSPDELILISDQLWNLQEREYQYVCIDMWLANKKRWDANCFQHFIELVERKSWWDTVDAIASNLIGVYCLKNHNDYRQLFLDYSLHKNSWLNRVALIHQLTYKEKTDTDLLESIIINCKHKNEFFIQKGIGWALRQYSYIDAAFVKRVVSENVLSALATREALKAILRNEKNINRLSHKNLNT